MSWAIWWPVGLAAVFLVADLAVLALQRRERVAIAGAREGLRVDCDAEEMRQRSRLAELRETEARCKVLLDMAERLRGEEAVPWPAAPVGAAEAGNVVPIRPLVTLSDDGLSLPPVGKEG